MKALAQAIQRRWYGSAGWLWLLWPLSRLFGWVAARRRQRTRPWTAPVPVIVVGNIAVGGTGKTPVVAALIEHLREIGYRPGVVSRGYGGRSRQPKAVTADSDPALVGDEPVLLAQLCQCPVWVDRDRPAAVRALLAASDCDVVIADDGLQHYALGRDLEIVVVDGQRGLGNGQMLPVGPLREPAQRLASVDWVLINGGDWQRPGAERFALRATGWVRFGSTGANSGERPGDPWASLLPLSAGPGGCVHAVAGIGNPQRFFATLRELGLQPVEHPFADHHPYRLADLEFAEPLPIVTTGKDAVKLGPLLARASARASGSAGPRPGPGQLWYLAVRAQLPATFLQALTARLEELTAKNAAS